MQAWPFLSQCFGILAAKRLRNNVRLYQEHFKLVATKILSNFSNVYTKIIESLQDFLNVWVRYHFFKSDVPSLMYYIEMAVWIQN